MKEHRLRDLEQDALDIGHAVIFGDWPTVRERFTRAETPEQGAVLALMTIDALLGSSFDRLPEITAFRRWLKAEGR